MMCTYIRSVFNHLSLAMTRPFAASPFAAKGLAAKGLAHLERVVAQAPQHGVAKLVLALHLRGSGESRPGLRNVERTGHPKSVDLSKVV